MAIELVDARLNRAGIGALVTLTDGTGRRLSREIQLGGGFMSFDAPRLHFGLPGGSAAQRLQIRWPDGGESIIEGPLPAGRLYRIERM